MRGYAKPGGGGAWNLIHHNNGQVIRNAKVVYIFCDPTYEKAGSAGNAHAQGKCAWTPAPFIGTGGYAYQYEWSNADSGCVKTK